MDVMVIAFTWHYNYDVRGIILC